MDQNIDYKLQKSTHITFTRWLPWKKNGQISRAS